MLPPIDINKLEAVMKLMETYQIDELGCEEFTLKKSRFKTPEPTEKQIMDKHTGLNEAKEIASHRIADIETFLNGESV
jgi:hypothetical protein